MGRGVCVPSADLCIVQTPSQRDVELERVEHIGVSPADEMLFLGGAQPGLASACQLRSARRCAMAIELGDAACRQCRNVRIGSAQG